MNVFISHSKRDNELVRVIDHNFRTVDIIPLFMEFTPESEPPNKKIEENVNLSDAVFLFLTENIISSIYTQNWISFEVGLAKKSNKSLFIIEDFHNKIHFPVPYLTDYILYEPTKIEDWQEVLKIISKFKQIIENNRLVVSLVFGGAILGALTDKEGSGMGLLVGGFAGLVLGGVIVTLTQPVQINPIKTKCPNCKLEFNLYSKFPDFPCPSCRMNLKFGV